MTDQLQRLTTALADRYTIEQELGAGGMAIVYLAQDLKHGRKVALKLLRPALAAILGTERFLKEIEVTARLHHPHILPLHDSGSAGGFLYYVMPYVEGESLREKISREGQLGVDETVRIASDVAAALDYAHRHNVVHRDIKPENILMHDGRALVADFGIAVAVSAAGGTRLTETGMSLGTPEYMSPEQAAGEKRIASASDVYSLGAVTYEMLAGEPPHTGTTVQAVIARVVSAAPEPIKSVRPSVPAHVDAAVQKSLAKVPGDRFSQTTDFADALANPMFRFDTGTAMPRFGRAVPVTPRTFGVAVIAALVLVALTAFVQRLVFWPDSMEVSSVTRFDLVFPAGSGPYTGAPLAISPDGMAIVFGAEDSDGVRRLHLRRIDSFGVTTIPGTEGAGAPFFSPDGSALGFTQAGRIRTTSLDGGEPGPAVGAGNSGSWGSQNRIVFVRDGTIFHSPATGGDPTPVAAPSDTSQIYVAPEILPDGRTILFHVSPGFQLAAVTLDGREVKELGQQGLTPQYAGDGIVTFRRGASLFFARFDSERLEFLDIPQPFVEGVGGSWSVSHTGTVGFIRREPRHLVSVDRFGTETALSAIPADIYSHVRFSPDGGRLLVRNGLALGDWAVRTHDLTRGSSSRVTFNGASLEFAEWTPDGQSIIYPDLGDWPAKLYSRAADGSGNPSLILARPNAHVYQGALTADRRTLVFWEWPLNGSTGQDVWVTDLNNSGQPRPLARTRFWESEIALSPDGNWVAYRSNESGDFEIYVRRIGDGEDGRRILVSVGGGGAPRWSVDGQELYYRSTDSVMVVPVDVIDNELRVGIPRGLFADRYLRGQKYDVHPDGQQFVFITQSREDIRVEMNVLKSTRPTG